MKKLKAGTIVAMIIFVVVIILAILLTTLAKTARPPEPAPGTGEGELPIEEIIPEEIGEGKAVLRLDGAAAARMIAQSLPDDAPFEDISVVFSEPNDMSVYCTAVTERLSGYLPADLPADLPGAVKAGLKLLPDRCDFSADLSLFSDGVGGITAKLGAVAIGSLSLGAEIMPAYFSEAISTAISDAIRAQGIAIERISILDGMLEVEGSYIK